MNDGLAYIRRYYGVPAYKDVRVKHNGRYGVIIGHSGPHVKVLFDGRKSGLPMHPTELDYIVPRKCLIEDDEPKLDYTDLNKRRGRPI